MKKTLVIIALVIFFFGFNTTLGTQSFADEIVSSEEAIKKWQQEEAQILITIKEKIEAIEIEEEKTLAEFIFKRIKGEIGKGIANPTKRKEYYDALMKALLIKDSAERLSALKKLGQTLGKTADEGTDVDDSSDKAKEKALQEKQSSCLKNGGSWNFKSESCTSGTDSSENTGQGAGSNNLNKGGNGSSGGGSDSGSGSANSGNGSQSSSSTSDNPNGTDGPPPPNKALDDGSGIECGHAGAKVTAYGYGGDHTSDSNSNFRCNGGRCAKSCSPNNGACGMGNKNNLLRDNHSFAVSDIVKTSCNLKVGDVICVDIDEGRTCGVYEDRSPQKFPNVDRYLPNVKASVGNNYMKRAKGRIIKLNKNEGITPHPGKR